MIWPFRKRTEDERDWAQGRVPMSVMRAMVEQIAPRGCPTIMYEPGVTHEHRCIASSEHGDMAHTCECGITWEFHAVAVIARDPSEEG